MTPPAVPPIALGSAQETLLIPLLGRAMESQRTQSWLLMDTVAHWVVGTQAWHDAMRQLSQGSWFQWACDQPESLQALGLQLRQSRTFSDCGAALMQQAPWPWPISLMTLAWSARNWPRRPAKRSSSKR